LGKAACGAAGMTGTGEGIEDGADWAAARAVAKPVTKAQTVDFIRTGSQNLQKTPWLALRQR